MANSTERDAATTGGSGSSDASRIVAEFAHDIKNPLSLAKGACESLHELVDELRQVLSSPDDVVSQLLDDLEVSLELSQRNVNRALDVALDTLERARGAARPSQLIPINDLVMRCVDAVSLEKHGRSAVLTTDLDPATGTITGSPSHLERAVANLLDNAVDAATLRAAGSDGTFSPSVVVHTTGSPDGVIVAVEDNGVGWPDHLRDGSVRRFETTKVGGTGLGLPISAQVAAELGGELRLGTTSAGATLAQLCLPRDGGASRDGSTASA